MIHTVVAQRTDISITQGVQEDFLEKVMFEWSVEGQDSQLKKWIRVFHAEKTACMKK